jgi:phage tail-like protein
MNPSQIFQLRITDADGNQRVIPLPATTSIGRQVGNDLLLDDERVSRRHAKIECGDEVCHITDLGSSNGTTVNEERLHANVPVQLTPGAVVRMGSFELLLKAVPAPEPAVVQAAGLQPAGAASADADAAPAVEADAPPPVPPPPSVPTPPGAPGSTPPGMIPPGLTLESSRLINYLPGIYHTEFMVRFLGIFEAILTPIEWNIDNFDLYLDPATAPRDFIPWLASWFDIAFDPSWTEAQRRYLLKEAHSIYARRGTKWALSRVLEIYTGQIPVIVDTDPDLEPFTFKVTLPAVAARLEREMIERLIDAHKPAHTLYTLEFQP